MPEQGASEHLVRTISAAGQEPWSLGGREMPTLALATGPGDPSAFGLVIYFIFFIASVRGRGDLSLTVRGVLLVRDHLSW